VRILLTAFEPFGNWDDNSSSLCVASLMKRGNLPVTPATSIYPVDFARAKELVEQDMQQGYDFALHLGQGENSSDIRLERIARNVGSNSEGNGQPALARNGPLELRTHLPLQRWNRLLRDKGIPTSLSHDAGCFVCNAVFYWSLYYSQRNFLTTQSAFIHLPLARTQLVGSSNGLRSLETEVCADAVEIIIRELAAMTAR
jgi:pyroglutamyl-peptidase